MNSLDPKNITCHVNILCVCAAVDRIRRFFKKKKDESSEVQPRQEEGREELSPVAVAADEEGRESATDRLICQLRLVKTRGLLSWLLSLNGSQILRDTINENKYFQSTLYSSAC